MWSSDGISSFILSPTDIDKEAALAVIKNHCVCPLKNDFNFLGQWLWLNNWYSAYWCRRTENGYTHFWHFCCCEFMKFKRYVDAVLNKANLRDLIAATGLVISNWIQIVNFFACVIVKFDGWPRKTIGHFFYTTSSFLHHFKSIGEFKLDLQSRKAQFGSKLVICYPVWPRNLMDDLGKQ